MKHELVVGGAAIALLFGAAGVASAAPEPVGHAQCAQPPCGVGGSGAPSVPTAAAPISVAPADDTDLDDDADGDDADDTDLDDGGWGDDEQVDVVPEGGAPTGDGSTEGSPGWWVGGGLLAALATAGLAFGRRLAGLAGR